MSTVPRLYRAILTLSKRAQRPITPVRESFHKNKHETDPQKIAEFIHQAEEHLAFLKMVTPRVNPINTESGVFVFRDGKIISGAAARTSKQGYKDNRIDPDDLRRHERLVRRQHFMDRN